jgi:hypothetical protein
MEEDLLAIKKVLQFDTQLEDSPFCDKEITPIFLKSNVSAAYLFTHA